MIASFKCKLTQELWITGKSKKLPPDVLKIILRKLLMLDSAVDLKDLYIPVSNHLEVLRGDRDGQHSLRVNIRYRFCFIWKNKEIHDVEVIDYH